MVRRLERRTHDKPLRSMYSFARYCQSASADLVGNRRRAEAAGGAGRGPRRAERQRARRSSPATGHAAVCRTSSPVAGPAGGHDGVVIGYSPRGRSPEGPAARNRREDPPRWGLSQGSIAAAAVPAVMPARVAGCQLDQRSILEGFDIVSDCSVTRAVHRYTHCIELADRTCADATDNDGVYSFAVQRVYGIARTV